MLDVARGHAAHLLYAAASAPASECIGLLQRWIEENHRRWKRLDASARAKHVAAAAATFGDLVCRELGWHWATLRIGDEVPCVAIANAARTCALRADRFMERQFTADDCTLKLQFNMLRAGRLPAAPGDGSAVIG